MSRFQRTHYNYILLSAAMILLLLPVTGLQVGLPHADEARLPLIEPALDSMMQENPGATLPIIVQFQNEHDSTSMHELLVKSDIAGIEVRTIFDIMPVTSMYATQQAVESLQRMQEIVSISLDKTVILETQPGDYEPAQIGSESGYIHPDETLSVGPIWAEGYSGDGITVAVIDSGADGNHPDLQDRIIGFQDFVAGNSDMNPQDGVDAYDDNGHGTACAWLIAGTGIGTDEEYTGLAPGADLLIIKTLDSAGAADDSLIAEGIQFAIDEGVDIISLSVGGEWIDDPFYPEPSVQAVKRALAAGIVVVVAGGNAGPATETITSPGVIQEVITVGSSIGGIDTVPFSSRGPVRVTSTDPSGYFTKPDILAPGYFILSGISEGADPFEYPPYNVTQFTSSYTLWSGTSSSCPQIAALAALLLDKHPGITPIEVKAFLMAGATDLGVDSMEQGYGLANVTRSSELIQSTSGVITLMTPLRYPTLPGTNQVFVIGDHRPPQNVTVISTVNRGLVTIESSGNASDFISVDEQAQVSVGYSYFTVGLDIPEELPLSALGRYSGFIDMIDDEAVIASIELDLLITAYGGRLLVDMAHHSTTDPDDASYYRYFGDYLREQGMIISEYPVNWEETLDSGFGFSPFDSSVLGSTEVLMIMDTENSYSSAEIAAIQSFVEKGGALLIVSEGFDTINNVPAFAIESYNAILQPYGIQCEDNWIGDDGGVYGVDAGGSVDTDPLTEGVQNIYVLNGGTLSVDSSVAGAEGLVWTDSGETHALLATVDVGEGKIIALSDGSILYDTSIYDAINLGADNLRLLKNIAEAIQPTTPRIYDVLFQYGEIGESANFTAYIFEENLDVVEITVYGPNGELIDEPVIESLGYKYFIEFNLVTAGFYEISIIATDMDGNTRTFVKTFLIPVSAVDDELLMGVMYSLLAIVGIALVYVGILKFGGGKKKRPRIEREWSPEWENDEAPPSIE